MDIVQLAKDVERKRNEYNAAVRALAEALGPSVFSAEAPKRSEPRKRSGVPVSQRVLEMIESDPDGVTRAALVEATQAPTAVHSALKKYRTEGKIEPGEGGRWRKVKAKGKVKASAPPATP